MSGQVIVREVARADLDEIANYIARDNVPAGHRFYFAFWDTADLLASLPGIGKRRRLRDPALAEIRSWSVKGYENYLIFYRPTDAGIEVLRVLHGARDLGSLLGLE